MPARLGQLATPPIFYDDEEKTRTARLLNVLLIANLIIWALALIIVPLVSSRARDGIPVALGLLVTVLAWYLMRSGRVRMEWGVCGGGTPHKHIPFLPFGWKNA